uniref:Diacylglycerol acyltransferase 4 n=1 Tax=Vitellaria paradoxa TaxID=292385 RepID=A0A9Y0CRQ5_9ERIC|nr:diacylglycerol acyltransferase 4 [Vitellaria paradoxa]
MAKHEGESEDQLLSLNDYFELSKEMIRSDGGPPRWFSPLECGSRLDNSPLLLFLPGIDGVGLGLSLHHQRLGKIFDIWCLHIPVLDRTPFSGLVELVERTVRSENCHSPKRPIYLVGESIGACVALSVAARNPDIDLILILANPATCFSKSQLQPLIPLLQFVPQQLDHTLAYISSLMTGVPLKMVMATVNKRLPLQQTVRELSESIGALPSYLSVLADVLPRETLLWKLQMLRSASAYANSCLHAVKAQTLILSSGKDMLLPSQEEGERLRRTLPNCEIRRFDDCGHALFLEDGIDLVFIIKGASFYRRARYLDCATDYMPPTPFEFERIYQSFRVRNTSYSGQNSLSLLGWQQDLEQQLYLLVLLEKMILVKADAVGEVANQDVHLPIILPKLPGRFYYFFGKPIETRGRKQELRSREKAQELYLEVKSEVEKCIDFLKEKREHDPYRNIMNRLIFQSTHGFDSEVPTFDI